MARPARCNRAAALCVPASASIDNFLKVSKGPVAGDGLAVKKQIVLGAANEPSNSRKQPSQNIKETTSEAGIGKSRKRKAEYEAEEDSMSSSVSSTRLVRVTKRACKRSSAEDASPQGKHSLLFLFLSRRNQA
jgi:hypothetical protein